MLAAENQHLAGSGAQQAAVRSLGSSRDMSKRNLPPNSHQGTRPQRARNYSIEVSVEHKCPACAGQHTYTHRSDEVRPASRLTACKEVFGIQAVEEKGTLVEGEKGCRICMSGKSTADECFWVIPCRFVTRTGAKY